MISIVLSIYGVTDAARKIIIYMCVYIYINYMYNYPYVIVTWDLIIQSIYPLTRLRLSGRHLDYKNIIIIV